MAAGVLEDRVRMSDCDYDLTIRASRLVCPATGLDGPGAVAVRGERIVAAGPDVQGSGRQSFEFPNAVLLPGLIDLHAHPAREGSKYGVDPDTELLPRGTTTDLTVLRWNEQAPALADVRGAQRPGGCWEPALTVRAGQIVVGVHASACSDLSVQAKA